MEVLKRGIDDIFTKGFRRAEGFDRFNEKAKGVLQKAQDLVVQRGDSYIGTGHLLWGVIKEGSVTAILDELNVIPELTSAKFENADFREKGENSELSNYAKRAIELSVYEKNN